MITFEVTAAIDAEGNLQTFYVSDERFVTKPTDTPDNTAFDPTLIDFTVSNSTFKNASTTGASSETRGELVIANINGQYDDWVNYSFDGRDFVARLGKSSDAYPAAHVVLFRGKIENITAGFSTINLVLRDMQMIFERPVLTNQYLGNNVLPAGIEGVSDIKGKFKVKMLGSVYNYRPECVNTSKLVYQVNDGPITSYVAKDKGVVLTPSTDYATSALLLAATFSSGVRSCKAEGLIRLGAAPAGAVTVDVVVDAVAANNQPANILKTLASWAGVSGAAIDTLAFDQLALDTPYTVGIAVTGEMTFAEAMDEIVNSVGAFYVFTPQGLLTTGRLTLAVGSADFYFYDYDIQKDIQRRPARDNNLPAYAIDLNYNRNYSPASGDLAGSVGIVGSSLLSQPWQVATANDLTVVTQFTMADRISFYTLLRVEADAIAEATRLLDIYKVRRDIFEITVHFDSLPSTPLFLMASVTPDYPRFGLNQGKPFRLLGIDYRMANKTVVLTIWG